MSRVSVCVPTYNGAPFIRQALDSILSQSYTDFELLVNDDASTDATRQRLDEIRDPRFHAAVNARRLGLVGNWNRCVECATGRYVCIFHQDDQMKPTYLQCAAEMLEQHPQVGFVFTNITRIAADGTVLGGHWNDQLPRTNTIFDGPDLFQLILRVGNLIPCQTVLMRAACVQRFGLFDARLAYTPDLEMWLRQSLHSAVGYIATPLVLLRRHTAQESERFLGDVLEVMEVWRALQIVFRQQRPYIPEPERMFQIGLTHLSHWSRMLARGALRQRRVAMAVRYTWLAAKFASIRRAGLAALPA